MLESCSSHLAGLNTVMGNTRIKVEYRGRDIIGGNKFKRIASRRKGKRKGGREEMRREEERSERKRLSELSRFIFESVFRKEKLEKTVREMGASFFVISL